MMKVFRLDYFSKVCVLVVFVIVTANATAQAEKEYQFIDAQELVVVGQYKGATPKSYHRLDTVVMKTLPNRVAELAKNSAGIYIQFQSNSKSFRVKWVLDKYITLWNMTPLGVNGLDLYGYNGKSWQYVAAARPLKDSNDVVVINNLDGKLREYRLYLPLYSEIKELQIGIEKGAVINKPVAASSPKVVIYGSSITQGASASRPGMAYPAILGRSINCEFFNMGFSGSGKMELAMAKALAAMPADVYILDCVPNPTPAQIQERALPFLKELRKLKPGIPIIMVESIFREDAWWDSEKNKRVKDQNQAFLNAYQQLKKENWEHLYYLPTAGLIGNDHEATIDGTHLTDVGFQRLAVAVEKILRQALAAIGVTQL